MQSPGTGTMDVLSRLRPHSRDAVRVLHREFCQQVRFGASVPMNRGKCETFLQGYRLYPDTGMDTINQLLLDDIHSQESYFNAHPHPSPSKHRAHSPDKKLPSSIFSTCAPCGLPSFVHALQCIAGEQSVAALERLIAQNILPTLEKKVPRKFWAALRQTRHAFESDAALRLLLRANAALIDGLFYEHQLAASSSMHRSGPSWGGYAPLALVWARMGLNI